MKGAFCKYLKLSVKCSPFAHIANFHTNTAQSNISSMQTSKIIYVDKRILRHSVVRKSSLRCSYRYSLCGESNLLQLDHYLQKFSYHSNKLPETSKLEYGELIENSTKVAILSSEHLMLQFIYILQCYNPSWQFWLAVNVLTQQTGLLLLGNERSLPQMTAECEDTDMGGTGHAVFSYHISEKLPSQSGSQGDLAATQTILTIWRTLPHWQGSKDIAITEAYNTA